jgi:hypothetical protein
MIDLLHKAVEPKEYNNQFEVLPKGKYECRVATIGEWKPKTNAQLSVFEFDSSGKKVQDAAGKDITHIEKNVTTYSCQVIFEVLEGEYAGAKIYYYLNLHPNQPWAFPAFISACGITEAITPDKIQAQCLGSLVNVNVDVENKPVPTTDKTTGLTTMVERERNVVKGIRALVYKV